MCAVKEFKNQPHNHHRFEKQHWSYKVKKNFKKIHDRELNMHTQYQFIRNTVKFELASFLIFSQVLTSFCFLILLVYAVHVSYFSSNLFQFVIISLENWKVRYNFLSFSILFLMVKKSTGQCFLFFNSLTSRFLQGVSYKLIPNVLSFQKRFIKVEMSFTVIGTSVLKLIVICLGSKNVLKTR